MLISLFGEGVHAQNLVNNWSFEDTVACPTTLTQIDRAAGWMSFRQTPDYFNACAPSNVSVPVSVPHNIWGDQLAHTGNAYAFFCAYASSSSLAREFVATQLNQPLIVGQKYFLSFWVSTSFGYMQNGYPGLACNNIGARFSTEAYSQSNPQPVDNFAHIVDTTIINDTINWVKISGSFIADSVYQYLSIGNFFENSHTTFIFIGTQYNNASYYLDDIKLSTDSDFVNSIGEHNYQMMNVFPNPARDWIVVSGSKLNEVILYDILGNLCYKATGLFASTLKIDIASFSEGMYFIRAKSGNEYIAKKIIIKH